jgi:hypothetical protein
MGTANRFYTKQELTQKGESTLLTYARNRIELCGFDSFLFRMAPQQRSLQIDRKILTNHPNEFIDTFDACCITHKIQLKTILKSPLIHWYGTSSYSVKHLNSKKLHDPMASTTAGRCRLTTPKARSAY